MNKIPTVFVRDEQDRRYVTDAVTPGCEWVLAGEGVATRKYDGTCCMFDGVDWWARREVKPGKRWPDNYQALMTDEATGKTVGWEPMAQSSFARWHAEAVENRDPADGDFEPGTYELCGPKVNGNPEDTATHLLLRHADAQVVQVAGGGPYDFAGLSLSLRVLGGMGYEGIVWHHPDGRMAKLKARDLPQAARP